MQGKVRSVSLNDFFPIFLRYGNCHVGVFCTTLAEREFRAVHSSRYVDWFTYKTERAFRGLGGMAYLIMLLLPLMLNVTQSQLIVRKYASVAIHGKTHVRVTNCKYWANLAFEIRIECPELKLCLYNA